MKVYVPRAVMIDGREVEVLVPIEAEEETRGGPLDNDWDWDNGPASPPPPTPATRLVTPWDPQQ